MLRRALLLSLLTATAALSQSSWDSSGSRLLSGKYFFRYVSFAVGISNGTLLRGQTATGVINFDAATLQYSIQGQSVNATSVPAVPRTLAVTGGYRVAANAVTIMDNPIRTEALDWIYGAVGESGVFVGSSTESGYMDLFIAIPAGTQNATNARVNGTYWVGSLDFPGLSSGMAKNALFQITANGQGGFPSTTVRGRAANANHAEVAQALSAATYSFAADGTGTANFTNPAAPNAAVFGGNKIMYVSGDGNFLLGGSEAGFDIFIGVRPFTGSGADAAYQGVYFTAGLDDDASTIAENYSYFSTFYGSINALGTGRSLWHLRTSPMDEDTFDHTYDSTTALSANGTQAKDAYTYVLGAGGNSLLMTGNGSVYSLMLGVKAPAVTPTGVFMDPYGILNSASYAPITNSIAPGELITIFGSNLSGATLTAQSLPFPTTLGGVRVLINDRPAPVYAVSPGQISAIVPYATVESIARVQVNNNGTNSNSVTLFVSDCAPGVFAVPPVGTGFGAILHADYSLVTPGNPARPGETVQLFLTGLGETTPAVGEGAPGPSAEPFARVNNQFDVYVAGRKVATPYIGLAPGLAGLYQINLTLPADLSSGDHSVSINGPGCVTEQTLIPVRR
jgi:uncharacterized protein (TIGR03437 family)